MERQINEYEAQRMYSNKAIRVLRTKALLDKAYTLLKDLKGYKSQEADLNKE